MKQPNVRILAAVCAIMLCLPSAPAMAQQDWSARDEQMSWIEDPHMHAFYEATVEAFSNGPDKVDRDVYEARSREIFTAFALARNMPVEGMLDHLKAIPGQMIENARRDPQILASYDAFVDALFGPQSFPANAPTVGGGD